MTSPNDPKGPPAPDTVPAGMPRAEGAALGALLGMGEEARDHLTILSGTAQNIAGLAVFVLASFGMNIVIARAFGEEGRRVLGLVTLATQLAFVVAGATRFGMDMAAVRRVAIEVGKGEPGRSRAVVRLAVSISVAVSVAVSVTAFALAAPIAGVLNAPTAAMRAAAVALPFVAVAQVILGGSRGLKIMRDTLVAYWVGQPISWIVFSLIAWNFSKTVTATVATYGLSWLFATAVGWVLWHRDTARFEHQPAEPGEVKALMRYGAPRAPAALLSQALFYTDFFVLSAYTTGPSLGVYAASVRVAQALVLFLTAVSYMFSPFVADLHERGERDRLNTLFKAITRWTLAGTIPLLLLFMIAPGPILQVFGAKFQTGTSWLRILLIGQIVNVSVGAAGFVLIMAGRTGWDLIVYASSFLIDLGMSFGLVPRFGPTGAAVAQATTLAVSNAFRLYLVWRFVHIQPYDRHYARLAIPAAAAAAVMVAVHGVLASAAWPVDLAGTGLAGGIVYLVVLVAAGLTPTEKRTILRLLRRGRAVAGAGEGTPPTG